MGELQARVALEEQREEESRREAFGLRQKVVESEAGTEAARKEVGGSPRVTSCSVPCITKCPHHPTAWYPAYLGVQVPSPHNLVLVVPRHPHCPISGILCPWVPPLLHCLMPCPWLPPSRPCSVPYVPMALCSLPCIPGGSLASPIAPSLAPPLFPAVPITPPLLPLHPWGSLSPCCSSLASPLPHWSFPCITGGLHTPLFHSCGSPITLLLHSFHLCHPIAPSPVSLGFPYTPLLHPHHPIAPPLGFPHHHITPSLASPSPHLISPCSVPLSEPPPPSSSTCSGDCRRQRVNFGSGRRTWPVAWRRLAAMRRSCWPMPATCS